MPTARKATSFLDSLHHHQLCFPVDPLLRLPQSKRQSVYRGDHAGDYGGGRRCRKPRVGTRSQVAALTTLVNSMTLISWLTPLPEQRKYKVKSQRHGQHGQDRSCSSITEAACKSRPVIPCPLFRTFAKV